MRGCGARGCGCRRVPGQEDSGKGGEDVEGLPGATNDLANPPDKPLGKGLSFYRRVARSRPPRSATRRLGADAEPDLSPLGASDLVLLPPQGPPSLCLKDTTPACTPGGVTSLTFGFLVHKMGVMVSTALPPVGLKWGDVNVAAGVRGSSRVRAFSFSSPEDKNAERHLASFYLTPSRVTKASAPKVLKETPKTKNQNHKPTQGRFCAGVTNLNLPSNRSEVLAISDKLSLARQLSLSVARRHLSN